jgi:hypothetical protein
MSSVAIDSTEFYVRQARRLRHELRDKPQALHRSLAALAQWKNLTSPPQPPIWRADSRRDHIQDLIAGVAQNMEGPILRYPARIALLKQAKRAGIPQFDANLIITATQHRLGERLVGDVPKDRPWLRKLVIGIIVECWIVAGIWWMLSS